MNIEQKILEIPIEDIIPNRFQPRLTFDDRGLEELAESIKQHGIIQPLVLRRISDKYEIIAGERRYKAATMAGLTTVPGIIADIDDNKSAEVAIVENVQRRNLSPIEEARSYKNLLDKGYLTQSDLAKKMGVSQSAIANKLRLLNLGEEVQDALLNGKISERHARSLLVLQNYEDQKKWLDKIINERLTVRELDEAIKNETNEDGDNDIPLVRTPDIEAIKKEATELPNINAKSDINDRITEIEREKSFNPDVIPVDQATNNAKGNFFNFLENETVNMNMEDSLLKTPILNINNNLETPTETNNVETTPTPVETNSVNPNVEPVVNLTPQNIEPTPETLNNNLNTPLNEVESPTVQTPEPTPSFNFGTPTPPVKTPEEPEEEVFDPISLIDTLAPDYEEKKEVEIGLDLKTAINKIRDFKEGLCMDGFNITISETDLPDNYQILLTINK